MITVVADSYLAGVSPRRMDKLVKTLGIDSLSKSQVSRRAADLDQVVDDFRRRPWDAAGPFRFVTADALTMKVREAGRVINTVVLLATGANGDGHREVLGLRVATAETGPARNEFFADLVALGLAGIFSHRDAIIRLVGAVLAEQPDQWAAGRLYLGLDILTRCRINLVPTTEPEIGADTMPALTA